MKQLTFTISEELFDEISGELSNELMAKWFKEAIYNQNLKDDNLTLEIPKFKESKPITTVITTPSFTSSMQKSIIDTINNNKERI